MIGLVVAAELLFGSMVAYEYHKDEEESMKKNTESNTSGRTSNVDYIIDKYNLPSNVTNAWESMTACWGPVAYYTTGEIEYVPYRHGLFGLRTAYIPREKVYEKALNGGPANTWSICGF